METLLRAALLGHRLSAQCRDGCCATCEYRLVEGRIREVTESGDILSDEELNAGCILACQSAPKGDVRIEVDLTCQQARCVAQECQNHDIARLVIHLDDSLVYQSDQLPGIFTAQLLPALLLALIVFSPYGA